MAADRYTVVQHTGYGYKGDPQFERGLQAVRVSSKEAQRNVEKVGGQLFHSLKEAEQWAMAEMYPGGAGLIPLAPGTFADVGINGLAIYCPVVEK